MAELLGIVAGGAGLASLAVQLGESGFKIKRLYNSYQEAPKRLKDLSEDLENFSLTIRILERDRQQSTDVDRGIVDQCVRSCSRASAQVYAAVNRFEIAIKKSNIKGRVLTALGQTSIIQLCDDLERAKTSLIFAFNLYTA